MFGSGMAESKAKEVELADVPWVALKTIVDFSYTGKILLAGSTVVAIIRAANLLQVGTVERAAVDFLAERLDAEIVLDAMALGSHLSAGEIGRDLRDRSRGWLNKNFGYGGGADFLGAAGGRSGGAGGVGGHGGG
jgi:hypothetical protein